MSDGLVVVDKPGGMTSHDVVARVRRALGTRKVGHAGTLDPMATGVLILGAGRATRLLGHLLLAEKSYDATVRLGQATNTDDADGEVVSGASAAAVDEDSVRAALRAFVGNIEQVPSTVSAIKVGGKRAYALARQGEEVVLEPRPVTIRSIELRDSRRPATGLLDVDISVTCSSGTYIRAVARDVGAALMVGGESVGGHLTALRRTTVGPFSLSDAVTLEDLDADRLTSMAEVGERLFAHVRVDEVQARAISHGKQLDLQLPVAGAPVALLGPDGDLLALYEQRDNRAVPVTVLVSA